jgi:SH3-like domain-containing protein
MACPDISRLHRLGRCLPLLMVAALTMARAAQALPVEPSPPHAKHKTGAHTTHQPERPAHVEARPVAVPRQAAPPAPAAASLVSPPVVAPTPASPPPAAPAAPPPPDKGTVTGLPLPRFASLRSDEVNWRTGPGTRYPINWVYQRRDLPVEIEREFEVWRLVEDQDGTKGWVHQATLTGRRGMIVTGVERTLHASADPQAAAVAKLMPGVVGHILKCEAGASWCQIQVGDYRGWLPRTDFWGSLPGEAIQ